MTDPSQEQLPLNDPQSVPEEGQKSIEEVAQEVIAGHWGRGLTRKRRLQAAGYDVSEIDNEMVKIFNQ